jgi:hypothetical protein
VVHERLASVPAAVLALREARVRHRGRCRSCGSSYAGQPAPGR